MIEIHQGESATYDFSLEISGSAAGMPEIRFTVAHPSGYLLSYPTVALEHGGYRVVLSNLDAVLPAGQHPCALEVMLGDRYFKPLFETLKLVEKATASVSGFNRVDAGATPSVTVTAAHADMPAPQVQPAYESKEPSKDEKKFSAVDQGLFATLLKKRK